jgi:hypothetical protein
MGNKGTQNTLLNPQPKTKHSQDTIPLKLLYHTSHTPHSRVLWMMPYNPIITAAVRQDSRQNHRTKKDFAVSTKYKLENSIEKKHTLSLKVIRNK